MNFLNLSNWKIIEIVEEKNHYFVRAAYENTNSHCPNCPPEASRNIRLYGMRKRCLKDAPVRGKTVSVFLSIQKHICLNCDNVFADQVPELDPNARLTKRLVSYIETHSLRKSLSMVSHETGVSESEVGHIFHDFINTLFESYDPDTPRILGMDDVHIGRIARCVLTDIEKKKCFDILPKKDMSTIYAYLKGMKCKENVEIVTMDMCRPFYNCVKDIFPKAEIVIDTYHVQRMGNQAVMTFLRTLKNKLGLSHRRIVLPDRHIFKSHYHNLNEQQKITLKEWLERLPVMKDFYEAKQNFFRIWRFNDREEAEQFYINWKEQIPVEISFAFGDIVSTIDNWHCEIFNYFDYKVTNAFTESLNGKIKALQMSGRRFSLHTIKGKIIFKDHF